MKKLLSVGLLTVCALALSEHHAQAWVNSKFSIGLNWHHQSGNTSTLWGLWRNGQIPGPEAYGPGGPGMAPPYGAPQGSGFPFLGAQSGYQGAPQQNAYQQNAYQQNAYQQNAYQQNAYQQNAYQQNAYQQYAYQQNAYYPGMQQAFQAYPQNYSQALATNQFQETAPPPLYTAQQPSYHQNWNGYSPYQSVSYQSYNYGNGSYLPSYYSTYSYGVPYYWYATR